MNSATYKNQCGYLKDPFFDFTFIFIIPVVAITAGVISYIDYKYFELLVYLNLWLLGYHHVIATYTRLAFDGDGFEDKRFLIYYLPMLVLACVAIATYYIGVAALATIYIHWQWYHYTRQSEGISKAYSMKSGAMRSRQSRLDRAIFYLIPVACFLDMVSNQPTSFFGMKIWVLPVGKAVTDPILFVSSMVFIFWLYKKTISFVKNKISFSYYSYLLSHYLIYFVAYVFIDELNYGWLVINIWHNAQYIAFVWLFNTNKYGNKIDSDNHLLFLAKPKNFVFYFLGCLAISSLIYMFIEKITAYFPVYVAFIAYQVINFHHYIVDSKIWKLSKKPVQATLKLDG